MNDEAEFEENDIETRLEDIESRLEEAGHNSGDGLGIVVYVFGATLSMILSWSRNAGILFCIGHGILSWVYVVYFAVTR